MQLFARWGVHHCTICTAWCMWCVVQLHHLHHHPIGVVQWCTELVVRTSKDLQHAESCNDGRKPCRNLWD